MAKKVREIFRKNSPIPRRYRKMSGSQFVKKVGNRSGYEAFRLDQAPKLRRKK